MPPPNRQPHPVIRMSYIELFRTAAKNEGMHGVRREAVRKPLAPSQRAQNQAARLKEKQGRAKYTCWFEQPGKKPPIKVKGTEMPTQAEPLPLQGVWAETPLPLQGETDAAATAEPVKAMPISHSVGCLTLVPRRTTADGRFTLFHELLPLSSAAAPPWRRATRQRLSRRADEQPSKRGYTAKGFGKDAHKGKVRRRRHGDRRRRSSSTVSGDCRRRRSRRL